MYYNSTDNGNVCSFHPPPGTRISKVTIERRKKNILQGFQKVLLDFLAESHAV